MRKRYPNADDIQQVRKPMDEEPDVVETASGISPNYDKFDRMGMSAEQALTWCNMD